MKWYKNMIDKERTSFNKVVIVTLIGIVLIILIIIATYQTNASLADIPKGYIDKVEYYDNEGLSDHTDYAKYIYKSKEVVLKNKEYKKVKQEDIQNIIGYFENFAGWMTTLERLNEYDFDTNAISEGDYIKIITKEGQKIGDSKYDKYDNYSIYFFDIETLTLYYIHSNI